MASCHLPRRGCVSQKDTALPFIAPNVGEDIFVHQWRAAIGRFVAI